jgi:hypothetical protein
MEIFTENTAMLWQKLIKTFVFKKIANFLAEKMEILTEKTAMLWQKLIKTLFFKKIANFFAENWPKSPK